MSQQNYVYPWKGALPDLAYRQCKMLLCELRPPRVFKIWKLPLDSFQGSLTLLVTFNLDKVYFSNFKVGSSFQFQISVLVLLQVAV